jgi:hypothetical protein
MLAKPRINPPTMNEIIKRLSNIEFLNSQQSDLDLSMFFHDGTLNEMLCLKDYFLTNKDDLDYIDDWIRMVATNRLTGHSKGFFSVYTLPPNQATTQKSQLRINEKRNQTPEYRNVKEIIINKSASLLKDVTPEIRARLSKLATKSHFYNLDAGNLYEVKEETISLTVTSPPFLNIVQYCQDNWMRCWFNGLDLEKISKQIVMAKTITDWSDFIEKVFSELYRITKLNGHVAFEVGEVNNGKIKLEEYVVEIGLKAGFDCVGILINSQVFTKTSNIWGVTNNDNGTNTNRIVLFKKRG